MPYARQHLLAYRDSTAIKARLWGLAGITASALLVQYLARRAESEPQATGKLEISGTKLFMLSIVAAALPSLCSMAMGPW